MYVCGFVSVLRLGRFMFVWKPHDISSILFHVLQYITNILLLSTSTPLPRVLQRQTKFKGDHSKTQKRQYQINHFTCTLH